MPIEQTYFPHGNATPWCKIIVGSIVFITVAVIIRNIIVNQKEKPTTKKEKDRRENEKEGDNPNLKKVVEDLGETAVSDEQANILSKEIDEN